MSDAADEFEFLGRQLLKKSRTAALREHMQSFLDRHERPTDLENTPSPHGNRPIACGDRSLEPRRAALKAS